MRKDLTLMSFLFGILLSMFAFQFLGAENKTATQSPTVDFAEPPYWMASYDEFNDFGMDQRKFYLENLQKKLSKVTELSELAKEDWNLAQKKYQTWENHMTKVYQYCQKPANKKSCSEIAEVRLKAFEMHQTRK